MNIPTIDNQHIAYDIAVTLIDKIGPRNAAHLVDSFGSATEVFMAQDHDIRKIIPNNNTALAIINGRRRQLDRAYDIFELCTSNNIKILTKNNPQYPQLLKQCPDAPYILYARGDAMLNNRKFIACVGTRKATARGLEICRNSVTDIAKNFNDATIISGLALGIDSAAHRAALDNNIPTIAVMPGWVDDIVPRGHFALARSIVNNGGAIVSEMPPGTNIIGPYFLARNRIIAAMAHTTIVMQSSAAGGSMVTADIASSYDRDVFVPLGDSLDNSFQGNHNLLKSNRALVYQTTQDIANTMGWKTLNPKPQIPEILTNDLLEIYSIIPDQNPFSIETIAEHTNKSISYVSAKLTMLEMKGFVRSIKGRLFVKNLDH